MSRRSAASLLVLGLLFADGSWLGRLEILLRGLLGGEARTQGVATPSSGTSSTAERGGSIDPNG